MAKTVRVMATWKLQRSIKLSWSGLESKTASFSFSVGVVHSLYPW